MEVLMRSRLRLGFRLVHFLQSGIGPIVSARLSVWPNLKPSKRSEVVDFETEERTTSPSLALNEITIDRGPSHYICNLG